jgi:hypothetical protein
VREGRAGEGAREKEEGGVMLATLPTTSAPQWAELKNCYNAPVMQEFRGNYRGLDLVVRGRAGGSVWRFKVTDAGGFVKAKGTDTERESAQSRADFQAAEFAATQVRP